MNDTSAVVAALVRERHAAMTAEERWRVASSLFETARAIVDSSLPADLSREERRLAIVRRLYGTELPEAALAAHARFVAADQ
jgi:hypothetical protein